MKVAGDQQRGNCECIELPVWGGMLCEGQREENLEGVVAGEAHSGVGKGMCIGGVHASWGLRAQTHQSLLERRKTTQGMQSRLAWSIEEYNKGLI